MCDNYCTFAAAKGLLIVRPMQKNMRRIKPYLDQQGRALPFPWLINTMLMLVGGTQTARLKFWSRRPKHAAEKTLRELLARRGGRMLSFESQILASHESSRW